MVAQKHSPQYPNFPLEKALQLARQIFEKDRKNPIDRDVAAQHIGYSGPSGAADKALATLAHYGLVERAGKGQLRVTQTLVDILYPDTEQDKREALRTAGLAPTIFQEIRERFTDGTPSEAALRGWLVRESFLDRAILPVTKAYLGTLALLEQSNAFESDGAGAAVGAESPPARDFSEDKQMHTPAPQTQQFSLPPPPLELNKINAEISGSTVRVSALLDREGLEKLEKRIAALKDLLDD